MKRCGVAVGDLASTIGVPASLGAARAGTSAPRDAEPGGRTKRQADPFRSSDHTPGSILRAPTDLQRHASIASSAFCVCRRFSAWSKTTDASLSRTSEVTSSPRWAGRQCMKSASGAACAISAAFTW